MINVGDIVKVRSVMGIFKSGEYKVVGIENTSRIIQSYHVQSLEDSSISFLVTDAFRLKVVKKANEAEEVKMEKRQIKKGDALIAVSDFIMHGEKWLTEGRIYFSLYDVVENINVYLVDNMGKMSVYTPTSFIAVGDEVVFKRNALYNDETIFIVKRIDPVEAIELIRKDSGERVETGTIAIKPARRKEEMDTEQQLQDLLTKANEGQKALMELHKLAPDRLLTTLTEPGSKAKPYKTYPSEIVFSLAPLKPKLEPFSLDSWGVHLAEDGATLHIGCQSFTIKTLVRVLRHFLYENGAVGALKEFNDCRAIRVGIVYGNHTLVWDHAEILYNKIKEL